MKRRPFPLLLLLLLLPLLPTSIAVDTITPSTSFIDGDTLVSDGDDFAMGFFSPGNTKNRYLGIWYNKVQVQTVVWVANRGNPIDDRKGYLNLSSNGDLILYNRSSQSVWSTGTSNLTSPTAQLLDTGNLVIREGNSNSGSFLWQSFDYPTDTLLPGMRLGWNYKTRFSRHLTTWTSSDDPSPGDYTFELDPQGAPEFFIRHGLAPIYRNGPWNGFQFSGEPEMRSSNVFTFDFTSNQNEVYYEFLVLDKSVISRFVLNQSMIQRYVWFASTGAWKFYWSMPRDPCDFYGACGTYGVCNSNDSPICDCAEGFDPVSPQDWQLRDFSRGCSRRTRLECPDGDGFLKMSGAKLPDTTNSTVDQTMSLEECRVRCLNNCSCTAYASANISAGDNGCIIWVNDLMDIRQFVEGGQDLYIRLAASELSSSGKKKQIVAIVFVTIACVMLLLALTGWCIRKRRSKNYGRRNTQRQISFDFAVATSGPTNDQYTYDETSHGKVIELPLFDMSVIVVATRNFSTVNKLGEGGFGAVYKGILEDGQEIAVKRLSMTSSQGADEFKNEVMLIAKLQHVNLVRLLGCCVQGAERLLIYEYMDNKSLDNFIFDNAKSMLLDWQKRFNIVIGIARGLLYLHQDSRFRIVHRDLKASNILLDKKMNPKISDFGIARIFGGDETGDYTKRVVGTYGYMSPEYAMDGIFSVKSDVFSFGILVLEIISGKKNRGVYSTESKQNLISYAWKLWKEGGILELVDEAMGVDYPVSEVLRCIQVGFLCVEERAEDRPHMSTVILMLSSDTAILPQPKQPGFSTNKWLTDPERSSSSTINQITTTLLHGR